MSGFGTSSVARPARQGGFSLVELMIGLVIGLIITMAITSSISAIGKQFRITGSGVSAAEGAQLGLDILDRNTRMAGAAVFSSAVAAMCPSINMYKGGTTVFDGTPTGNAYPAVRITDGGSAGSDTIDLLLTPPKLSGGLVVAVTKEMPISSSVIKVTEPRDLLQANDLVMVARPLPNTTDPCTLIQITDITGKCSDGTNGCNVNHGSGEASEYNPPNPKKAFTSAPDYPVGSVLIKFDEFSYTRFSVQCNSLLRHDALVTPSCTGTPSYRDSELAGDIMMLKAQYGIANADSDAISTWKSAATTTADELARVKAIRVAIVARSQESDNSVVTGTAPVVFDGGLTLDLSGTSVPSGKTWQNFRYRIHETVTPLRNVAWNR
ncbi:PilW family protein [Aromatoleum diolicum]|nr:PilW family protein [Aromatoleum diolicum]